MRSMNEVPAAGLFLYDQDCGFCRRSVDIAQEKFRSTADFVPWQETDLASMGLTSEQTRATAWLVCRDGRKLSGGDAIAGVMVRGRPVAKVLGHVMLLPGVRVLSRAAYRVVAANRHRVPLS